MANKQYPIGAKGILSGDFNPKTSTMKVLALDATATYDSTDNNVTDVIAGSHEVTDAGGTAYARQTLGTKAVTVETGITGEGGIGVAVFDAADIAIPGIDDTEGALVVFYDPGTGDANCIPWLYIDTVDKVLDDGTLNVTFATPTPGGGVYYWRSA